jgi:hypothetical protein
MWWPLVAILLLHLILQFPHLSLDYWNDELYSLEHFLLASLKVAVNDYHSTNNHILFSLLGHMWATLGGVHSMPDAVVHLEWMRLFPFLCSCLAIVAVHRTGNVAGGRHAGWIAALILVTSIPFYNYACQMRGYCLSMCLYAWLSYCVLRAWRKPTLLWLCSIGMLSLLVVYTLPSNLYFIAALLTIVAGCMFFSGDVGQRIHRPAVSILFALAAGLLIATLLYLPLRHQMDRLPIFSSGSAPIHLEALRKRLPIVAYHFLSARYLLLIPVLLFLAMQGRMRWLWIWCMAVVFLLPFLLADIRGNSTPYRVFLTGLPLLSVGLALPIAEGIGRLKTRDLQNIALAIVALYCTISCFYQIEKTRAAAGIDIEQGERSVDLYVQYNLHFFHPRADARFYMRAYHKSTIPLVEGCRMDEEVLKYLSMEGWDRKVAQQWNVSKALTAYDTVDVLTERPQLLEDSMLRQNPPVLAYTLLRYKSSVEIMRLVRKR